VGALGCGGGSAGPKTTTPEDGDDGIASQDALDGLLTDLPGDPPASPDDAPPRQTAPPPRVDDLAAARDALAHGHHAAAEAWLAPAASAATAEGQEAALLLGRLELATGRYDEAAARGEALAGADPADDGRRARARTLAGEAHARRGRLEAAERALRQAVTADPNAFRAWVFLGRVLDRQGRGLEARPAYLELVRAYNDGRIDERDADGLAYVGMAAHGLESPQDANDAFREAARADADRVETQLAWARLFLEKYDPGNAEASVRQALAVDPENALGHALMARIRIAQRFDFEAADAYLDRALEIDPSLVPAHVTRAGMALRDRDFDAALGHLDRALGVDPKDLEALSVRAAVYFVRDDDDAFQDAQRAVLAVHRSFSKMYTLIAEYADWEHRYPDIVDLGRKAVILDPTDGLAHATLGLNLLRLGNEDDGLTALREAWRRDRFHVQVFNTLELYDRVIPQEYEDVDADPFRFRMHRDEKDVLVDLVPDHLRDAWGRMVDRYGFTPGGPVRIELYADPEHFSVRTAGLPRIGVQGVCFGRVITALSPRGGPFNWGEVTWHELAHVFHIQLSDHRVPRWFTEGLAEWETGQARPEWKREDDHRLWAALEAGTVPPIGLLNRAFTHARTPDDATLAYYASTQAVTYLIETHGFEVIPKMLAGWADGRETDEVVRDVLGAGLDEVDAAFRAWLRDRLEDRAQETVVDLRRFRDLDGRTAEAARSPDDPHAIAAHAAALLVAGDPTQAKARAEQAVATLPGEPVARVVLARLALGARDAKAVNRHLAAIFAADQDGYDLRLLSARAAAAAGEADGVLAALQAAVAIDPDRPEAWQGLADLARRRRDPAALRDALSRLVDIDQHGRGAHHALLRLLADAGDWKAAGTLAARMLYLDPHDPRVHLALGAARLAPGGLDEDGPRRERARRALGDLDRARTLGADGAKVGHLRAEALRALGRDREAAEAEAEATAAEEAAAEAAGPGTPATPSPSPTSPSPPTPAPPKGP